MSTYDPKPKELIEAIANIVIAHADELTELDRVIGDADHGVNLTRGFRAVLRRMTSSAVMPLGKALARWALRSSVFVGGASGPLYGQALCYPSASMWTRQVIVSQDTLIHAGETRSAF